MANDTLIIIECQLKKGNPIDEKYLVPPPRLFPLLIGLKQSSRCISIRLCMSRLEANPIKSKPKNVCFFKS